ncbi:hypothetical protein HJ01_01139 [Flavobacterium frigoris PS1]|uniref:Uncharacterized protein n=1 Tax=Flavobacterium frigoris (strain PS1) TaxID=1086011 RepID=H7FPM9_FLAFP|nr:hypothetical protein HJ01_01139 [Flavobacterium frigoris PS1]
MKKRLKVVKITKKNPNQLFWNFLFNENYKEQKNSHDVRVLISFTKKMH